MRPYENDTELKIPNWYFKLPIKVLEAICNFGLMLNRVFVKPRKDNEKNTNRGRNVKFYL